VVTLADLITRAMGGEHLRGFLPGQDRRAAIARVVASKPHWSGPGYWCAATRDGIGDWGDAGFDVRLKERRADALAFATWDEVLAVIERGCAGGHRAAYEAAYDAWCAGVREAWAGRKPGDSYPSPAAPSPAAIHSATEDLIRHGCEQLEVQDALW
jgi:hypothetical protein